MKKLLKIVGITLGTLVGVVIVSVSVAMWCIFTPERLTPMVRQAVDPFISCEWDMGDVELTFFSTFPEFGLRMDGLHLINPMKDAPSDTVLMAPRVVAKVDVMAYLQQHNLVIHELSLPQIESHLYINQHGESNFDVLAIPTDTTESDSAMVLPFDTIIVQSCRIAARRLSLRDDRDSVYATLLDTELGLTMHTWNDIHLQLQSGDVMVQIGNETYANHIPFALDMPVAMNLEQMAFHLKETHVQVSDLGMMLDGDVRLGDSIWMDANLRFDNWCIASVLALIPATLQTGLEEIDIDGQLSLKAHAKGICADQVMPIVDAHIRLQDGKGSYQALPYTFSNIDLNTTAHLDLNETERSYVRISQLRAQTRQSHVEMHGRIDDLLGEQHTEAHLRVDAAIPDWRYFLPDSLGLDGHIAAQLDVDTRVADLIAERMDRTSVKGSLQLSEINMDMDSMHIELDEGHVDMDVLLAEWPVIKADLKLQSGGLLTYQADSTHAVVKAPCLSASVAYHTQDTTQIPTFAASISFKEADGSYGSSWAHLGGSQVEAKMSQSKHKALPMLSATLQSAHIAAQVGDNRVSTQQISLDAKSVYDKTTDNFLLQWNPMLKFYISGAEADVAGLDGHVTIPQIAFRYSNRECEIFNSSIILGQSDFSLSGKILQIGKWLKGQEQLTGELTFTSNHTDVNELMDLFSADAGSEEEGTTTTTTTTTTTDTTDNEPFLVPNDVDLTLNTVIREAVIFNQTMHNLGGKVYVKDGMLVLEEMGFVCDAAKLQLTAMYRTPRRNHIYLGFDYHMMDIKIDQLISMIPQVDSMVPMLRSFKGDAEFHVAAETYLNENMEIKTSTLRGACSIFGKDLVVMDSETFDRISKILMFKKKTENKVDSIAAEITLYKDEIDIYPFTVSIDNYTAALGGRHNLDLSFDYHVNLLSPVYIGVDIKGTADNLSIKPGKCIYAKDFKPQKTGKTDTQTAEFKQMIRNSLRSNVKTQ